VAETESNQGNLAMYSSDDPEILQIIKNGIHFDDGLGKRSRKSDDSTDLEDKDIFEQYKNIEMMDQVEVGELIGEINKYHTINNSVDAQKDRKIALLEKFNDQEYIVNRFGLDYKKLYHNFEGGYDI